MYQDRATSEQLSIIPSNKLPSSNPRLYDASKFRLASFKIDSNSMHVQIGMTSYKVNLILFNTYYT